MNTVMADDTKPLTQPSQTLKEKNRSLAEGLTRRKRMSPDINISANDEVNVMQLSIHGTLIGYLAGLKNGRNVLSIADRFKTNPDPISKSAY